jgi:nucleoside-diphosphate-sugar epimerase
VLGRRLVSGFSKHGHTVIGLTRDTNGDEIVEARGGKPRRGDLFDEASILQAADGADTIIHAATAIPTDSATPEAWDLNDRVRTEGAEALTKAAVEVDADQYLQQSIVYVARQPDGSAYDESSAPNPVSWTQSALDAEEIAVEAGEQNGFDVSVLRCGNFYGADSYYTRADGKGLIRGERPIIEGTQETLVSYLHLDDAAKAFIAAAEATQSDLWHRRLGPPDRRGGVPRRTRRSQRPLSDSRPDESSLDSRRSSEQRLRSSHPARGRGVS